MPGGNTGELLVGGHWDHAEVDMLHAVRVVNQADTNHIQTLPSATTNLHTRLSTTAFPYRTNRSSSERADQDVSRFNMASSPCLVLNSLASRFLLGVYC